MNSLKWNKVQVLAATLCFAAETLHAQTVAPTTGAQTTSPPQRPASTPYAVVTRDGNSRMWERTTYEKSRSGEWTPHVHSFTELATGLNHQDPQTGEWVESKEEIDILPDGTAAATNGQVSVYFPANIYSGVIELVTPDGQHLKSRPLGISYYDGTNSVLIAELTNSVGQLISSNQIIYTNAFTDFAADLVMTYRKSGFEADLVIRSQPPVPEAFGLSSQHCRMELLTEFFGTAEPEQTPAGKVGDLSDSTLRFGGMTMSRGKAFEIGNPQTAVSVSKSWEQMDGRTFLIEAVPVSFIGPELQSLPIFAAVGAPVASANSVLHKVSTSRLLPPVHIAQSFTNTIRFAKAESYHLPGVVWDYNILSSQSNFTFRGDTTYYVSNSVNLSGTTVIEAGSVIKYDTNYTCSVNILGTVQCKTGPYRPAIFTCVNDATVGESINSPFPFCDVELSLELVNDLSEDLTAYIFDASDNYYVNGDVVPANHGSSGPYTLPVSSGQDLEFNGHDTDNNPYSLSFQPTLQNGILEVFNNGVPSYSESGDSLCLPPPAVSSTALALANGGSLNDLIIRYVGTAIQSSSNYSVTNLQIVQCPTAFQTENASLYAGNVLISGLSGSSIAFGGQNFNVQAEQLTDDQGGEVAWSSSGSSSISLTNALITDVSSFGNTTLHTNNAVVKISGGSSIYRVAGAGSHYLATNSPYRAFGTTNINAGLLAQLRQKTTYPPVVYSNITILTNMEFGPHALRDTNLLLDLGFHYDSLDWCFGGVTANSNLTFDAGTAVGWFETAYPYGCGIALSNHVTNTFNGTATAPCIFAHYSTVQEGGNGNWTLKGLLGGISTVGNTNYFAKIDAKFMDSYALAGDPNHFRDYQAQLNVHANHCEFYCGSLVGFWLGEFMTNCLYDRLSQCGEQYKSAGVFWRNCMMHGGQVFILHSLDHYWPVWIENCAFDGTTTNINMDDYSSGDTNKTYCNFNAFLNGAQRLVMHGSNDLVLTNTFTWQNGPLGTFYQATNSLLSNTGSVPASVVGLYHFAVQTNEVPEGTNIVSIGYHYVALDGSGNPLDNNGDGIPDYLEDANGNGRDDSVETPWDIAIASQPQSINVAQGQPVTFSVTAAGTGPFTYQWKTNGISIPGAILSSNSESVVQPGEDGTVYSVLVSNLDGYVTSSNAVLSVTTPLSPINGGGPLSQTVLQGTNVSFTNLVNGNYLVYQWYGPSGQLNNGSGITGARSNVLTISNVARSDAGGYYAIVTNLFGSLTSSTATLTVITNPAISSAPTNEIAIQSDDVTFTVVASGAGLGYQWWLTNGLGTNAIDGAISASYTKLVVQTNDAGSYAVVITNAAGSTNASASLTVRVPPWITNQPVSVTTNQGDNVTFSVGAFGTTSLFYQWFKNGTNAIANATNASLILLNVQPADAAGYSVTITNIAGTNVSAWAWLSVNLTGGATTNGWGGGSGPPTNAPFVSMISPANIYSTNPAIYVRPLGQTNGPPMSIRASATSQYNYVTNVAFYTGTNLQTCTNLLGSAVPGANSKFAYAWTNSLHGTNLLRAVATDNIGLVSTSNPVYVVIDDAPTNSAGSDQVLLWPSGTVNTNLNLAGVVTDDGLPYGVTNTQWSLSSQIGPGTVTFSNALATNTIATFTGYGAYVLQLEADDGFATNFSKCNVTFRSPPGISIVTPINNSVFLTGGSITLDALAYGSNSPISTVDFYDGPNHLTNGLQALNNHYRNLWANAPLWTHLISAVAQDNNGLMATSAVVNVTVVPPLAAWIISPTNTQLFSITPTNILLTAVVSNFAGFAVTNVSFSNQFVTLGAATNAGGYIWQYLWGATNGTFQITVVARDNGGNSAINNITITNNAIPTVSITNPITILTNLASFWEVTNVTIQGVASDSDGSVSNVTLYSFGTNILSTNFPPNTSNAPFSLIWSNLVANYYPVTAVATDNRGATSVSGICIFWVMPTNPPPVVAITYPTNGQTFADGSDITITATATNYPESITNVEFFVNGLSIGSDPNAPYSIEQCCWRPGTYQLAAVAADNLGSHTSTNIQITIVKDPPSGQGFWDPTAQPPVPTFPPTPAYDCGNSVFLTPKASTVFDSAVYLSSEDSLLYPATDGGPGLYKWDGTNWFRLAENISGDHPTNCDNFPTNLIDIEGIAVNDTGVYVSSKDGNQNTDFPSPQYAVEQLVGGSWAQLGTNFASTGYFSTNNDLRVHGIQVPRLQFIGSDLYIFGDFFYTGAHTNIEFIGKWNPKTSDWEQVGTPLNAPVMAVAELQGKLVVGGCFTNAGGNTNANGIAEWDGTEWTNFGGGIGGTNSIWDYGCNCPDLPLTVGVFSLAPCNSNLFVGGDFTIAGNNTNANGIAVWSGSQWKTIGSGLWLVQNPDTFPENIINPIVYSIATRGDRIYVGGAFSGASNPDGTELVADSVAEADFNEAAQKWTWSSMDRGVYYDEDPSFPGIVQTISLLNSPSKPGAYDVMIGGAYAADSFDSVGSAGYALENLADWRVGYPQPPSQPVVTVTNPVELTLYTNTPSDIDFVAVATSSYTSIDHVGFYLDGVWLQNGSVSDDDTNVFSLDWPFSSGFTGLHQITAIAVDRAGLKGQSPPVLINILATNNTLIASNDEFLVTADSPPTSLNVLANDRTSTGNKLRVLGVYSLTNILSGPAVGAAQVSGDGSSVIYTPNPGHYGTDSFEYTVTDGVSTNFAYLTVKVRIAPFAVFQNPIDGGVYPASTAIPVNGVLFDYDTGITNFVLAVNGATLLQYAPTNINFRASPTNFFFTLDGGAISPQSTYTFFSNSWSTDLPGFYAFSASIADSLGYSNTGSSLALVTIAITNASTATNKLAATIDNLPVVPTALGTTAYTIVRNGLFDLQGTASDSNIGDPVSYQVLVHPFGDESTILANVTPPPLNSMGFHNLGASVVDGDLGTNDFSTLPNGIYDLELIVRGGGGQTNTTNSFQLQSDLKIGQFSFSEQDLALPVNGVPLTVMRTYDSLNPDSGPFGTSWSFALNDMDVQLDDQRRDMTVDQDAYLDGDYNTDNTGSGLPEVVNMRVGGNWDVTLTLPNGQRVTFPFDYSQSGFAYHVQWDTPPGVKATLEMIGSDEIDISSDGFSAPVWHDADVGLGTAPFQYSDIAGWILTTTTDGTKYYITRGGPTNITVEDPNNPGVPIDARVYGPPQLTKIQPISGDSIWITNTGVFHYDQSNNLTRSILFDRDSQGRIKALHDPNGGSNGLPAVQYIYDNDNNNLVQVLKLVDRTAGTYTTNKYHYDNPNFPHYITSIENGDGIPVARNYYDDSGRLTSVQDANGTTTYFNHSTTNNTDIVVDRLGNTNSYVYNLQGVVTCETNALGQVTANNYDDPNNPTLQTSVTNAYGSSVATWTLYAYDSNGNQTNVVFMGHTNSYLYDANGNLLSQVDPVGNVTSNLYDEFGNRTNTLNYDNHNNVIGGLSYVYVNGVLAQMLNANNQMTGAFAYDSSGNLTNVMNANGLTRSFTYDANGNQTNSSYQWTPPGGGSAVTVTTSTYYDAQNRVTQTVDTLGNTNSTFYDSAGKVAYTIDKFGNTNSMVYDALGNLIQTTYPNGTFTRTVYDAEGRPYLTRDRNGTNGTSGTMTLYDARGRATNIVRLTNVVIDITYNGLVAESLAITATGPISTNSTVYDAAGRVTFRTSPDGTTSYDYYPDGQVMHVIDPLNDTNFFAYDAADRQTNMVDALNHSTKFQYDALNHKIATIYNDNSYVSNVFNNLGQCIQVVDQATNLTQFGYDLLGQLTNVIKPPVPDPENGGTPSPNWSYIYDTNGNQIATIDPKGRATTNLFDAFNRRFSRRLPVGQTNLALYNSLGQLRTNYDFNGQRTELRYDQYGQLTNTYYFAPRQAHPSNAVSYAYDQLGRVTNIIQLYGIDAANSYAAIDGPGNKIFAGREHHSVRAALAWITQAGPKWGGPLVAFVAVCSILTLVPSGRKLRRMLAEYYLRGGWNLESSWSGLPARIRRQLAAERPVSHYKLARWMPPYFWRIVSVLTIIVLLADDSSWDRAFAQCSPPASSNINNSTPTTRITSYTYDFDGHMTQMNSPEGYIDYGYDRATGRLTSTCTTNSYIGYGYDALGRLQTVHVTERNGASVNEWTTNHYDKVGNRSEVDLPNQVVTKYYYDSLNRLTNMTHQFGTTNLASYSYGLNASGRRTNAVEILLTDGGTYYTNNLAWQFDGMYRLTNEVNLCSVSGASYTNAYVYDIAGNRLKLTQTAGNTVITTNSYDLNDELLREVTQANGTFNQTNNYAYDSNGSMTGSTNISSTLSTNIYTYDLRNKLSSVISGVNTNSFQYNDQGIRVRTMGASTTYYLVDANNRTGYQQVLEEFSTLGGTPTMSYGFGDDLLSQAVSSSPSYFLADGHGNTRQLVSNTAGVADLFNYDAYGNVQTATSSMSAEAAVTNNVTSHLYCSEQYDSTLRMYNLRSRYYDASRGRFNQRDSFIGISEDPMSLHKYLYADLDPVNLIDPVGKQGMLIDLMIGSLGAVGLDITWEGARAPSYTALITLALLMVLLFTLADTLVDAIPKIRARRVNGKVPYVRYDWRGGMTSFGPGTWLLGPRGAALPWDRAISLSYISETTTIYMYTVLTRPTNVTPMGVVMSFDQYILDTLVSGLDVILTRIIRKPDDSYKGPL